MLSRIWFLLTELAAECVSLVAYVLVSYASFFALLPLYLLGLLLVLPVLRWLAWPVAWTLLALVGLCVGTVALGVLALVLPLLAVLNFMTSGELLTSILAWVESFAGPPKTHRQQGGSRQHDRKTKRRPSASSQHSGQSSRKEGRSSAKRAERERTQRRRAAEENAAWEEFDRRRREWERHQRQSNRTEDAGSSKSSGRTHSNHDRARSQRRQQREERSKDNSRQRSQSRQSRTESSRPSGPPPPMGAFTILDLPPAASLDAVRARYKQLAKKFHPDANPGVSAGKRQELDNRMKEINSAFDVVMKWHQSKGERPAA